MSDGIKTAKIVEELLGVPVAADEAISLEHLLFRSLSDQVKTLEAASAVQLGELTQAEIEVAVEELSAQVWHKAYPDRRPWAALEQGTRNEWIRLMTITSGVFHEHHRSTVLLSARIAVLEQELCEPTMQCSDCGSIGPFRDITYPSTPNGPEEHDIECEACGSLSGAEGPHEAFRTAEDRWEKKAEQEFKRGLTVAAGICRNAQREDDYTLADKLRERIEQEIKTLPA